MEYFLRRYTTFKTGVAGPETPHGGVTTTETEKKPTHGRKDTFRGFHSSFLGHVLAIARGIHETERMEAGTVA
ncbi:hypothetical protein ZHAS_00019130 [Anopheles sinensis]|uniref:Uncharacterized protein n=1 Tax=Anopheles sinensis TaxID=74873 RepID=A0A084WLI1_ANOSI|nr:hypothetical protein ZHAS_00019130 [Anopheles sinensis]